jgi:phosphoglucomutase
LSSRDITVTDLAGEKIDRIIDRAPGDNAPIGGIKVSAPGGWFAARPSGTKDIYKIYAESFRGAPQLQEILKEAQATVDAVIARP